MVALSHPDADPGHVAALLRQHEPPIIGRLSGGEVCLDMRTLLPGDDEAILQAVRRVGTLLAPQGAATSPGGKRSS